MEATIFSFSPKGEKIALEIKKALTNSIHYFEYTQKPLSTLVRDAFSKSNIIVFIGAVGIAVRAIAPYITTKDKDPAVIVIDDGANFVIPILSGHIGGANKIAVSLANSINSKAVITTATDVNNLFAVDVWASENNLFINNIQNIKFISSALLKGRKIGFRSDFEFSGNMPDFFDERGNDCGLLISNEFTNCFKNTLWLTPKQFILGIGCRKNIDVEVFEKTILDFIKKQNITINQILGVGSIDLKAKEKAIIDFCFKYRIKMTTFSSDELATVDGDFSNSAFVEKITGIGNVCERAALKLSDNNKLLVQKTALNGITIAIAKKEWSCNFETCINRS